MGGGGVAERKALSLLEAGARVRVVSPRLTARLGKEKARGTIRHTPRRFRPSDLRGAFLAIAATDSPEDNIRVSEAAGRYGALVNAVDMPERCSFIVPATLRRGPLTIAVSTSGASPAMARAIRKELQALYGARFARYLGKLEAVREKALAEIKDPAERAGFLRELASEKTLEMLRKGRGPRAGRKAR